MADSKKTVARKKLATKRSSQLDNRVISTESLNIESSDAPVQFEGLMEEQQQQHPDEVKGGDTPIKKKIHLIDGEKGGVGKSLFCRVLLEYCDSKGYKEQIYFVEADLSNPDVGSIYFRGTNGVKQYIEAEFTKEEKNRAGADIVFELAMEKSVVVNLPSNIYAAVTAWFERNQIFTLALEHDIQVCKWFVCNGGYSSLEKFKESVNYFRKDITHIFVRNQVIFDDWGSIEQDEELKKLIEEYDVLQMDLTQLGFEERNKIDAKQLTFKAAVADDSGFGLLSKQRIKNFLGATYKGFERLNLLP